MRLLFVHQNFPGQYPHLARHFAQAPGHEVLALTADHNARPEIVPTVRYAAARRPPRREGGLGGQFAQHVARGEAVARAALDLKRQGYEPDVVLGHFGWGETLFLKDVWPRAPLLVYAEFFYGGEGADTDFDPEFAPKPAPGDGPGPAPDGTPARMAARARNASLLLALASADRGMAPTQWQRSRFPVEMQGKIEVVHDGVDTDRIRPDPAAVVSLRKAGVTLRPGDEVVTFVNRNLEPYRGYHVFMRALPRILAERPRARALIIGADGVSYGPAAPGGTKWRDLFLNEVRDRLDMSRVHLVGRVPYELYLQALQVSAVHVYLTYPFVLSWSMLEAMSAGCLVVGSDTAPVREVIRHGRNGLLVDFFNPEALASQVVDALADPERHRPLREEARRGIVEGYDLARRCLPRQVRLIRDLVGG